MDAVDTLERLGATFVLLLNTAAVHRTAARVLAWCGMRRAAWGRPGPAPIACARLRSSSTGRARRPSVVQVVRWQAVSAAPASSCIPVPRASPCHLQGVGQTMSTRPARLGSTRKHSPMYCNVLQTCWRRLGQIMSIRPDVLPPAVMGELAKLQVRVLGRGGAGRREAVP